MLFAFPDEILETVNDTITEESTFANDDNDNESPRGANIYDDCPAMRNDTRYSYRIKSRFYYI